MNDKDWKIVERHKADSFNTGFKRGFVFGIGVSVVIMIIAYSFKG